MAITIQLTEVPANETVASRVFTLAKAGGDFGTAFDCTIQLPDRSGQVAGCHGRFVATRSGMCVESIAENPIYINGKLLASGRAARIEDGTMLKIGDYVLLVSQLAEAQPPEPEIQLQPEPTQQAARFNLVDDDDDMLDFMPTAKVANQNVQPSEQADSTAHFANNGVLMDDPFGDDPFADEEINLDPIANAAQMDADEDLAVELEPDIDNISLRTNTQNSPTNDGQMTQLVSLLENQVQQANQQQQLLYQAIDETLEQFLHEFSPQHLEEEFSDYGKPLFGRKDKRYWRLYRNLFSRRMKKGDYQRIFKAMLLEKMQEKGK